MLRELRVLCRQRVQVALRTGVDGYGHESYGSDVEYAVRIVAKNHLLVDSRGEQVVATHVVYFATTPEIGVHDRITFSTGDARSTEDGARRPAIVSVGVSPDDMGGESLVAYVAPHRSI